MPDVYYACSYKTPHFIKVAEFKAYVSLRLPPDFLKTVST